MLIWIENLWNLTSNGLMCVFCLNVGFSSVHNRVIEIGACILRDREIVDSFEALCNPGTEVSEAVTNITGITTDMVAGKPAADEIMPQLFEFMGKRPIIAHNAPFDIGFLIAEMRRAGITMSIQSYLCTLQLSRKLILEPLNGSYKLESLREHTNFVAPAGHSAHRALADVYATVHLWNFLTDILKECSVANGLPEVTMDTYLRVQEMPAREVASEFFAVNPALTAPASTRDSGVVRSHNFVVSSGRPVIAARRRGKVKHNFTVNAGRTSV
jgi:DNA polymerase III subunit epsilon